jgi:hypothetical protein
MDLSLEERIARLERDNRRLRLATGFFCIVLAGVAVASMALAQTDPRRQPDKIVARELELRDAKGRVFLRLGEDAGGNSGLALYDAKRNVLGRFGVKESGETAVDIFDRWGNARAGMAVSGDGVRGGLYLRGSRDELHRVALSVSDEGLPLFVLYNKEGRPGALLNVAADGASGLALYEAGASRVKLAADSGQEPALVFQRKDGAQIWKAP